MPTELTSLISRGSSNEDDAKSIKIFGKTFLLSGPQSKSGKVAYFFICFAGALPTAFLASLDGLGTTTSKIEKIGLDTAWTSASKNNRSLAVVSGASSQVLNVPFNMLYTWEAWLKVLSKFASFKNLNKQQRWILLGSSVGGGCTALAFSAIAFNAFRFTGTKAVPGIFAASNFIFYFAPRFLAMEKFLHGFFDEKAQLRNMLAEMLKYLNEEDAASINSGDVLIESGDLLQQQKVQQKFNNYLQNVIVYVKANPTVMHRKRNQARLLELIDAYLGVTAVMYTYPLFAQSFIKACYLLAGDDDPGENVFTNGNLTWGYMLVAATPVFYFQRNVAVRKQVYDLYKAIERSAVKLLKSMWTWMTLIGFAASLFSGGSFAEVFADLFDKGLIQYFLINLWINNATRKFGQWVARISVSNVNWGSLLSYATSKVCAEQKLATIKEVDLNTARNLINNPDMQLTEQTVQHFKDHFSGEHDEVSFSQAKENYYQQTGAYSLFQLARKTVADGVAVVTSYCFANRL